MTSHTIHYDGFEVVADAYYEAPEAQNNIQGGWCLDSLACAVTSLPKMVEAYGASQARLMAADLEDWVTAHETANILDHFEADV